MRFVFERGPAGAHRVDHAAQAEQIATTVDGFAAHLFRRHVLRRAGDQPALRQPRIGADMRDAEVGDPDPLGARPKQDIGRLDVAVNQPLSVRGGKAGSNLDCHAQDLRRLQRPLPVDSGLQSVATQVGHGKERNAVHFAYPINLDHVFVDDRCRGAGLASEPLARLRVFPEAGRQHLQGDEAGQCRFKRLEHNSHPAGADHARNLVSAQTTEHVRVVCRGKKLEQRVGFVGKLWRLAVAAETLLIEFVVAQIGANGLPDRVFARQRVQLLSACTAVF